MKEVVTASAGKNPGRAVEIFDPGLPLRLKRWLKICVPSCLAVHLDGATFAMEAGERTQR